MTDARAPLHKTQLAARRKLPLPQLADFAHTQHYATARIHAAPYNATMPLATRCVLCNQWRVMNEINEHPLRSYRRKNGLQLDDLAEKTGVSRSTLSRIETRRAAPSLDLVRRLIAATNGAVSATDFFQAEAAE